MGAQAYAGRTPRGAELYREVGGDRWYVRVPANGPRDLRALNTVCDLHKRVPVGRFGSFTEAAAYVDGTSGI